MADLIVILIIAAAVIAAVAYIVKAKKNGAKCIGCAAAGSCRSRGKGGCGNVDIDEIIRQIQLENGTENDGE
jgi:hypothetical protein